VAETGLTTATITTARSAAEIEGLLDPWRSLPWSRIETDPEFFLTVCETRPEVIAPHVILVERDRRAVAMAVGRLEDVPLELRVGYKVLAAPTVRSLTLVNGGMAGVDDAALELLARELLGCLDRREADVLNMAKLELGSPAHEIAALRAPALRRRRFAGISPRLRVSIPSSFDAFLEERSWNTRRNLTKHGKRFVKEFDGRFMIESFDSTGDFDRLVHDMAELNAKTYKGGLGVGFQNDAEHRLIVERCAHRGIFRAQLLSIDGEPKAFWCGFRYGGGFFSWLTAYDPELAAYRIGEFLMASLFRQLCDDPEVRFLDWGFGDAQYKRSFSDECLLEQDVVVFAPTVKGLATNLLLSCFGGFEHAVRRAIADRELGRRLKRGWRRRLAADAEATSHTPPEPA